MANSITIGHPLVIMASWRIHHLVGFSHQNLDLVVFPIYFLWFSYGSIEHLNFSTIFSSFPAWPLSSLSSWASPLASSAKASASPPPGAPTAGAEAAHAYGAKTPGRWLAWGKWSTFSSMDWFKGKSYSNRKPNGKMIYKSWLLHIYILICICFNGLV